MMMFQSRVVFMALLLLVGAAPIRAAEVICTSSSNVFTVKVDLFASELGYFEFEECEGMVNPTIGLEIGETYTFVQTDRSNYMHPMGFAYYPNGNHHEGLLKPAATASTKMEGMDTMQKTETMPSDETAQKETKATLMQMASCVDLATCPAPMYFSNGEYLGKYSNIPEVKNVTTGQNDSGVGAYVPLFSRSAGDWASMGPFSIKLRFDDEDQTGDIFYSCHIHQYMSGRIKLLEDGLPINADDVPALGYTYDTPGPFDQQCGTFGLDAFQLPNPVCPDRFVCGAEEQDEELQSFADCIDAMDCHMLSGMTTGVKASDEAALFIHQMIPHHQNAVNMAKALLKSGKVVCADLTMNSQDCILETILREIVNGQNHQIQLMNAYLEAKEYPATDNCVVDLKTLGTSSGQQFGRNSFATAAAVAVASLIMLS